MSDKKINKDFEFSRDTLQKLIKLGMEAVEESQAVAKASQHPRAYEVFFSGIKNVSDMNDKFLEMHRRKQVIDHETANNPNYIPQIEDQSSKRAFIGSTDELDKAIEDGTIDVEFLEVEAKEAAEEKAAGYDTDGYAEEE